jgi:hypothetical protein
MHQWFDAQLDRKKSCTDSSVEWSLTQKSPLRKNSLGQGLTRCKAGISKNPKDKCTEPIKIYLPSLVLSCALTESYAISRKNRTPKNKVKFTGFLPMLYMHFDLRGHTLITVAFFCLILTN